MKPGESKCKKKKKKEKPPRKEKNILSTPTISKLLEIKLAA